MAVTVLHVIDHLGFGGAPRCLKDIVEHSDSREIENIVCALRTNPNPLPVRCEVISLKYHRYDPRTIVAISRLCRRRGADIVHAHLHKSVATCLLAGIKTQKPVIIHEHGGIFHSGPTYSIYRLMLRAFRHRVAAVIANSNAAAEEVSRVAGIDQDRIRVLLNAIDFERFAPDKISRQAARQGLGIEETEFVLGYVGRLNYVKGPDLLLEAFSSLVKKSGGYVLLLAGDGPQEGELRQTARRLGIETRVRFLGAREDIPEIMAACDVAVVPSRREAFGITALEFMRMRVPVVASGVQGMAELVADNSTALVPSENTPDEIAGCIERLAKDAALRDRLTQAAYEFTERFGIDSYVAKLQELYHEIASAGIG